jgi:hypothetical protein
MERSLEPHVPSVSHSVTSITSADTSMSCGCSRAPGTAQIPTPRDCQDQGTMPSCMRHQDGGRPALLERSAKLDVCDHHRRRDDVDVF